MSGSDLFRENSFPACSNFMDGEFRQQRSSRRSLQANFDREYALRRSMNEECSSSSQLSRSGGSWCDALSLSVSNVNAKQAWKNGTEKLSQTLNNVRTTFGALSQKIKKSTKRRQPLINIESPKTPITPYTRSKAVLGRTPTKLYSPFSIDTPTGKENILNRQIAKKISPNKPSIKSVRRKLKHNKLEPQMKTNSSPSSNPEARLSNDMLQTQIGIYEFQSVANRIIQNGLNN